MSRYSNIHRCIWNDDKFPFVSDDCQLVYFHLMTTPIATQFGLFKTTPAALAAEKRWPIERYLKAFGEAFEKGFVKYDERHQLLFLPQFMKYNPPHNPNVLISWGKVYKELPDCLLKDEFLQAFESYIKAFGEGFGKAFRESFSKDSRKDPATATANASVKEGGAGGDVDKSRGTTDEGQGTIDEGRREAAGVNRKIKIIAHDKSDIAFREFQVVIEKHLQDGGRVVITDPVSIKVLTKDLGGIDGIRDLIARNGNGLEKAFRGHYERREIESFVERSRCGL